MRFAYQNTDGAGFVEMSHEWSAGTPSDVITKFRQALLAVKGVTQVDRHPKGSKTEQNNPGNHYQEHTFVVNTQVTGDRVFIEFELTRHNHIVGITEESSKYTVTACFRKPSDPYVAEAWRVLVADVGRTPYFLTSLMTTTGELCLQLATMSKTQALPRRQHHCRLRSSVPQKERKIHGRLCPCDRFQ